MEIRELTTDDAAALTALYHTYEWWDDRELANVRASIEGADCVLGLVEVSGTPASSRPEETGDRREDAEILGTARIITDEVYYARIYDVLLRPSIRGSGHGERRVRAAREHPLLDRVNAVTLSCREGLVPFYERCGFERHDGLYEVDGSEEAACTMVDVRSDDG
jgi:predicted GNAT family N-acyltransferase